VTRPPDDGEALLLTVDEAAHLLAISPDHCRELLNRGELVKPLRLGRAIRVSRVALEQWVLRQAEIPAPSSAPAEAADIGGQRH
jgi:excisionase family DNA binding protein